MNNGDQPASAIIDDKISTHDTDIYFGLTKRETFAMAAMQGILSSKYYSEFCSDDGDGGAGAAVLHADHLLKELSKC